MEKHNKHSFRLNGYDYSRAGLYFITICTANREHYFGYIESHQLKLSPLGKIAKEEWIKTIEIRKDMNLELGEFIVMPNHIHGIIRIGNNQFNSNAVCRVAMHCDPTNSKYKNQFGPQSKNLSSILRGYKSAVTTYARKNEIPFQW